jgi:hypothetical protein
MNDSTARRLAKAAETHNDKCYWMLKRIKEEHPLGQAIWHQLCDEQIIGLCGLAECVDDVLNTRKEANPDDPTD